MNLYLSWLLSSKFYFKHFKKLVLTIFSISLGISLYLCVNSYKASIESYLDQKLGLFNTHNYIITSTTGNIAYEDYLKVQNSAYLKVSAAFIEKVSHIKNSNNTLRTVTIIATDLFQLNKLNSKSSNNSANKLFSKPYEVIFNTTQNTIEIVENNTIKKVNVYKSDNHVLLDNTILMDLVSYEYWFGKPLTFNYISATAYNIEMLKKDLARISNTLIIQTKSSQQKENQKITQSFTKNLEFLSLLAILISMFISYQFFFFIITERQKHFNTLRAIGMSTRKLISLLLAEIVVITTITWLVSISIGYILSVSSLHYIEKTLTEFFIPLSLNSHFFSSKLLLGTFIITFSAILISSLHPMIKTSKRSIQYRNFYPKILNETSFYWLSVTGVMILIISIYITEITISVFKGYIILLGVTLFFLLQLPTLLKWIMNIIENKASEYYKLPLSYIKQNIIHHSTLIFTLCLSMSLYLCLFIFISSFRVTVTDWINSVNWADYYIHHKQTTIQTPVTISPKITQEILAHPDVEDYDILSRYDALYKQNKIKIIAGNYSFLEKTSSRLKLKHPITKPLSVHNDVLISETFANKYNVEINDIITLEGPFGSYDCIVKNIFFAYLNDQGYVYMADSLAKKLYKNLPNHGTGILIDKSKETTFYNDFYDYLNKNTIYLDSFIDLRNSVITTFNSTFKITWVLAFIAAFIAAFTLINYISMFLLQFEKTFIQLRTLGAPHAFIRKLMFLQNSVIMIIAFVYSIVVSLSFSYILIVYINKPIFGWTINLIVTPSAFFYVIIIAFLLLLSTTFVMYDRKKSRIDSIKINYEI